MVENPGRRLPSLQLIGNAPARMAWKAFPDSRGSGEDNANTVRWILSSDTCLKKIESTREFDYNFAK
ncbi:MAG: hypothetical protein Hals2KO_16810 [Halioglobus sp.]